jgi:hypothetical protein
MSDLNLTINVTPNTWLVLPFVLFVTSAALFWNVDHAATPLADRYVGAHNAANFYVLSSFLLVVPGAFAAVIGNRCYNMLSYVSVGASTVLFTGLVNTQPGYASYSLGALNAYRIALEADPSATNIKLFVGGLFFYFAWFATFFLFTIRIFDRPMKANPSMDIKTAFNTVFVALAGLVSIVALWSSDVAGNPADVNYNNVFVIIAIVLNLTLCTVTASLHGSSFFGNVALYVFGLAGFNLLQNLWQIESTWAGEDADLARVKTGIAFGWGAALAAAYAALRAAPAVNTGVAPSFWTKLNVLVTILIITSAGLFYNTIAERLSAVDGGDQFQPIGNAANFFVTSFFLAAFGFCVQHATSARLSFFKPLWWTSAGLCQATVLGWNNIGSHNAVLQDLDLTIGGVNLLRLRAAADTATGLDEQSLAAAILLYIALPLAFLNTFQSREEWIRGRHASAPRKSFYLSTIVVPVFSLISLVVFLTSAEANTPAEHPIDANNIFAVPASFYYTAFYPVHILFLVSFAATTGFYFGSARALKLGLVASAYGFYLFADLLVVSGPGNGVCNAASLNPADDTDVDVECQTLKAGYVFALFAVAVYVYTALIFLKGDNELTNAAEVDETEGVAADADVDANQSRISDV